MTKLTDYSEYNARLRAFIKSVSEPVSQALLQSPAPGFVDLAKALFALQFDHVRPYQSLCKARGVTPGNLRCWSEIPAVPTTGFKELDFTAIPRDERTAVFHSSGTTQQKPSRHFHNSNSLAIYRASLLPWFKRHMLPEFSSGQFNAPDHGENGRFQILSLTPSPALAPHSSLVCMFETVLREWGSADSIFCADVGADGAWILDFGIANRALQRAIASERPVLLLGTAFSFVHLLDNLETAKLRLNLPNGSRALETGGYKGRSRILEKQELHSLITEKLGIPPSAIICEYGMSELSSQAYDHTVSSADNSKNEATKRVFRFPPWAVARIISPESGKEVAIGETGLIRIYDLANVYSVMAVQTEDLGIRRADGFELVGRTAFAEPRGCSIQPAE